MSRFSHLLTIMFSKLLPLLPWKICHCPVETRTRPWFRFQLRHLLLYSNPTMLSYLVFRFLLQLLPWSWLSSFVGAFSNIWMKLMEMTCLSRETVMGEYLNCIMWLSVRLNFLKDNLFAHCGVLRDRAFALACGCCANIIQPYFKDLCGGWGLRTIAKYTMVWNNLRWCMSYWVNMCLIIFCMYKWVCKWVCKWSDEAALLFGQVWVWKS